MSKKKIRGFYLYVKYIFPSACSVLLAVDAKCNYSVRLVV